MNRVTQASSATVHALATAGAPHQTAVSQLLLCLFLFSVALFLTTVIAKILASYFHKKTFFDQMTDTLKNVRFPCQ